MMNSEQGMSGATATAPSIDVWSFAAEKNPSLDSLLAIKHEVLLHDDLKAAVEKRLGSLNEAGPDARNAGIARWMLAQYHRAHPLLKGAGSGSAISYLVAECCLRAEVVEGTPRPMRRPDLAAKLLAKHDKLEADVRVWALYLDALLFDDDREAFLGALKKAPAAARASADFTHFEGRACEFEGDLPGALAKYDEALTRNAAHAPSLFRLAYHADLGGDDERAIELYEQLAQVRPLNTHALLNLGVLYEDHGRYEEAANCYRLVLDAFPNHRRARQYLRDAVASLHMILEDDQERQGDRSNIILRVPISDFELSVRARNCLAKMNIETLGDLVSKTEEEVMGWKNFGDTSLQEIRQLLASKGLRLGMTVVAEAEDGEVDEDAAEEEPIIDIPDQEPLPEEARGPVPVPLGIDAQVLAVVLNDIELSVRCRKALQALKVMTVGDLLTHSESELLGLKNFGLTSLNELKSKLAEYGVNIRG